MIFAKISIDKNEHTFYNIYTEIISFHESWCVMDYIERITELLHKADNETLKHIYRFVRKMLGQP